MTRGWQTVARLALMALAGATAWGAPVVRTLGEGLAYCGIRELPRDLPAAEAFRSEAVVLDLRFTRSDNAGAAALRGWLQFRGTTPQPALVLINAETERALLQSLRQIVGAPGVLLIGPPVRGFKADIDVRSTTELDRRSLEAIDARKDIAVLLADNPEKVRNDEASLSRDRLAEASAEAATDGGESARAVPVDPALQRAVHIHRAWLALRRP